MKVRLFVFPVLGYIFMETSFVLFSFGVISIKLIDLPLIATCLCFILGTCQLLLCVFLFRYYPIYTKRQNNNSNDIKGAI